MRHSMPLPCNLLSWSWVLLVWWGVSGADAAPGIYRGDDDKPADPSYSYAKTVFDCQPPDSLTVTIGSATTLSDSTIGRQNLISSYPCAPWAEGGPELIYRLDVAANMTLSVVLSGTEPAVDLDIFLLNDCDSDSCLVGANTEFRIGLTAGIYYLVVDGASLPTISAGNFTLDITGRALGVPAAVCAPGGALPVTCAGGTITIETEDLFDQPDLIYTYNCGTTPKRSGEIWYALTLPGTHEVTVIVRDVAFNLDVNFWLFAGCGPDAKCLQFVDQNLANEGESLTWINESESPVTAYLAVDAARLPAAAGAGLYTIDFQCQSNVPTTATSFGSLKALYR